MNSAWRKITRPLLIYRGLRQEIIRKSITTTVCSNNVNIASFSRNLYPNNVSFCSVRHKSKKQKAQDSDDEGESFEDDNSLSRDSKIVKFNTTSLRTDLILKTALGIARNKIEQLFYESKIRVNGKKILKKSLSVKIGDEIDVIKAISPKNPDHLYISRIEIMNLAAKEETIAVTARRFKSLLIENYETDPYKGSAENEE
ncbi:hypothetical protein MSG28_008019 [Choristoneura fumiferana]|uniref:Uncharacterized protein n=1 Tax=Choristoneura fumiferana TaxID=7141 RepID=A0ACC0J9L0_CHOFU|nr:hypothetical protein MSG28_008019 [Choristoneura fumiferana]